MQRRSPQSNTRGMRRLRREISSETLRGRQVQGRQETRSRLRVISHSLCSREAFIYSRGLAKRRLLVFLLTGAVVVLFCKQKSKVGRWGILFRFGLVWCVLVWFGLVFQDRVSLSNSPVYSGTCFIDSNSHWSMCLWLPNTRIKSVCPHCPLGMEFLKEVRKWSKLLHLRKASICRSQSGQGHHKNPQNQLTWAHRDPQTLTFQLGSLHGADLDLLRICYSCVARSSCGNSDSGSRGGLWLFCQLLGTFSSHWVTSSSFNTRGGA